MPRYFFRLVDDGDVHDDGVGQICADDEAARHEAGVTLAEIARDVLAVDGYAHEFEIFVIDEGGQTVWQTSLDFQATRRGSPPAADG